MKHLSLLFAAFLVSYTILAQRPVQMRTMWQRPQVHVLFNGYTISFTIKDINKALVLLYETGDHTYGTSCGLDTAGDYVIELYAGMRMEYRNPQQRMMQQGIGAFLLGTGHALVQNKKHKKVMSVNKDIEPLIEGQTGTVYKFYDPQNGMLFFYGVMPADMYTKDIGLD